MDIRDRTGRPFIVAGCPRGASSVSVVGVIVYSPRLYLRQREEARPLVGNIICCYPRACEEILVAGISPYISPWLPHIVFYITSSYLSMVSRGIRWNFSMVEN